MLECRLPTPGTRTLFWSGATDAAMNSCLEADIIATALFDPYAGEGLVYMSELYSGTATCVRQMLHRFGSRLRALIVDCVPAQECGVADIAKDSGPIIFYKFAAPWPAFLGVSTPSPSPNPSLNPSLI